MLDRRAYLSLAQYLQLQSMDFLSVLFEKHGLLEAFDGVYSSVQGMLPSLREVILAAQAETIYGLLDEIVRTEPDLRTRAEGEWGNPAYRPRWADLVLCLSLTGYRVERDRLVAIDPTVEMAPPLEDDLTREISQSGLVERDDILRSMEQSANDFRRTPPDLNGCMTHARIALETLGRSIAKRRGASPGVTWGAALSFLREQGLITEPDERALAPVYTFVSQGAHRPVGVTEVEMAALARRLTAAMSYFLVVAHNRAPS
jgi:hypothetical protein